MLWLKQSLRSSRIISQVLTIEFQIKIFIRWKYWESNASKALKVNWEHKVYYINGTVDRNVKWHPHKSPNISECILWIEILALCTIIDNYHEQTKTSEI